ncbi:MAG TPA: serine O-acetyltransferase [Noviherbaspirillum sp.]|nr:serine O-acetyltransferase [Noviherbaspirillum sp.]
MNTTEATLARRNTLPASLLSAPGLLAVKAPSPWTQESIWLEIRAEAEQVAARETILLPRLRALVLDRPSLASSVAAVVARRLASADMPEEGLRDLFDGVMCRAPDIAQRAAADLAAVKDRDPACPNLLHVLLNLKGFQSLQSYRIAHALWEEGREELAFALSNQASVALGVDIHPAARIGCGVMFDHATGIVIGETTVVEDHVSILQNVTLGGTGKEHGDRHPKIRTGVMIGAGAKILGNIEIGTMSKIAAGSVVLRPVPAHCTVAGVPARIVRHHRADSCPSDEMDQTI